MIALAATMRASCAVPRLAMKAIRWKWRIVVAVLWTPLFWVWLLLPGDGQTRMRIPLLHWFAARDTRVVILAPESELDFVERTHYDYLDHSEAEFGLKYPGFDQSLWVADKREPSDPRVADLP